jgi:hypothetical protein
VAVAAIASIAALVLGVVWLGVPDLNPFGAAGAAPASSLVGAVAGRTAAALGAVLTGASGLLLAVLLLTGRATFGGGRVTVLAASIAALAAATLGSMLIVAFTGYLFGFAAVLAGVVTVLLLLQRRPRVGILLIIALVALVMIAALLGVPVTAPLDFAGMLGTTLWESGGLLLVAAVALAATFSWAAVAAVSLHVSTAAARAERWLVVHRIAVTVAAALAPVPYALVRATWLTPWPLFGPSAAELETTPVIRVTGLIIGSGAVAAAILTLGLILPWGRTLPRWIPGVGGRPVPIAAAAVPGFAAAGILLTSAAPTLLSTFAVQEVGEAILSNLLLPFWFWGPALAAAVWAYVGWRTNPSLASGDPRWNSRSSRDGRGLRHSSSSVVRLCQMSNATVAAFSASPVASSSISLSCRSTEPFPSKLKR